MRNIIVNIARFIVSVTFILSGFVKAVDPVGTQYKIADYLAVLHLGQYIPDFMTLFVSVLLSAAEFWLGVCLLFAIRRRVVTRCILGWLLILTPLTLWLAISNPISDCGCFGDAVVLTNWQTFWKNVILLGCTILCVLHPFDMLRFISKSNQWIVMNFTALFIFIVSGRALYDLPYFDFRPYHIGTYFLEVVVLTAHTETLLRICLTAALRSSITKDDVLELIHTCIGKHQRWVVLHDHRS